jgi:hypothetical protein
VRRGEEVDATDYDATVTHDEPGERPPVGGPRKLDRAPSERYARGAAHGRAAAEGADAEGRTGFGTERRSAGGPIARAVATSLIGAAALVVVGGVLAVTSGLLFISGIAGAATGLLVAEAAVGDGRAGAAMTRDRAVLLAVVIALGGTVVAVLGLWAVARAEGGALGPIDLLVQVYGLLIPAAAILGAITAGWGASVGPVRS